MITLREAFLKKYNLPKIPQFFEIANGCTFDWENITKARLSAFVDYLQAHVTTSSSKTYCAYLKSVLNLYSDQIQLPKGFDKVLSVKSDPSEHVFLNEFEIFKIIRYKPDTMAEAIVQQQFVISALVGARHSDAQLLTNENIAENMICYISKKTRIKATVPLSPVIRKLLETGILYDGYNEKFAFAFKSNVSDTTFNETLRRIAMLCDIDEPCKVYVCGGYIKKKKYELLASHAGRRSFATCLYMRCHDLYLVSRMCGHSDVNMTIRYLCVPLDDIQQEVLQFFEQFK